MIPARIDGATRVCGKSQGYLGLAIKDELVQDAASGFLVNQMTSAWEPSPEEIAAINAGAKIHVSIFGVSPPPMILTVGKPPE